MSLSSKAISLLAEYGLSVEQIVSVAAANERASEDDKRSGAAIRQARYRARKSALSVTRDVTRDVTHDGVGNADTVTRDVTNHNEVASPRARREDITSNSVDTCQIDDDDLRASDWPKDPLKAIVAEIASPWLDPAKSPGLITSAGNLARWRREGASWEHDVLPVVRGVCARARKPIGTWTYFDAAVSQAIADNRRALALPEARGSPVVVSITDRIAEEQAEARRRALARLDAQHG